MVYIVIAQLMIAAAVSYWGICAAIDYRRDINSVTENEHVKR